MITDPGFKSPLRLEQIDERLWLLRFALIYHSVAGPTYTVPAGFVTDLASVPRLPFAYWLAGGRAAAPACLHDFLYQCKTLPRSQTDALFLEAMDQRGIPWGTARLMYSAVRSWGWIAWNRAHERRVDLPNQAEQKGAMNPRRLNEP